MYNRLLGKGIALLRWSEKYTKTDMVFVASTGGWALLAQFISSVASFGLAFIVARFVSKTEYGTYQYILSIVGLLGVVSLTGLPSAVMQSVARGFDQSLVDGFWLNLRWSAGVVVGTVLLSAYYLMQDNVLLSVAVLIAGLTTPLRSSFTLYASFLNGKKDAIRSALYVNGIGNVVPMIFIALTAFFFPRGLYLVIAYTIGNLCTVAYLYSKTRQLYPPTSHAHDDGLKVYGFHMSFANVLGAIANSLDNLLLFHFLGPAEVAVYNFATALPDQTKAPMGAIATMMTARFAGHSPKTIRESMPNKLLWLTLFHIVMIGTLIVILPYFFHFFFPAYASSVPYAQLYSISLLTGILVAPGGAYLTARKLVSAQYTVTIANSLFQIVSLVIGVVTFGLLGMVVARIATRLFGGALAYAFYEYDSRKAVREGL